MGQPRRRSTAALVMVALVASLFAMTERAAVADTPNIPVTATAAPMTGLSSGSNVHVTVDARMPPNPAPSSIFGVEARLCAGNADIALQADFNPSTGGQCISAPLEAATNHFLQIPVAPPNEFIEFDFKVGVGTNTYNTQFGDPVSITCGAGNPCKLVLRLQTPGANHYKSFLLTYADVATVPGAPTGATATAGNASANVSWTAPASDGGSPITGYTVTSNTGGHQCTTSGALNCTVNTLTNGTPYTFTVHATNAVGDGPESMPSNEVTPSAPTVPGAPTGATATAGDMSANVSWTAPASTGGSPITGYTVTSNTGGHQCTTAGALNCMVNGLTNGTPYTFTVHATNAVGDGPESAPSNEVTPNPPPAGDFFHALDPVRILDSRAGSQVGPFNTPWGGPETREFTVAGAGGVPANNVDAVVLNITVTGGTQDSFLTIYPNGDPQPLVSSLNWKAGVTRPNAVTVKLGTGGKIKIFNPKGTVHVIIDVNGYYDTTPGGGFTALDPVRIMDSRAANQVGPFNTPWAANQTREFTVTGGGVPADADAVVLNVTITNASKHSHLAIYPNGATQPLVSSLNWAPGITIPNAVTVKVGTAGKIKILNNDGNVDVIIDIAGYFKVGAGKAFHPLSPVRIQDSRSNSQVGAYNTPWGPQLTRDVKVTEAGGVPAANVDAVLMNATITNSTAASFLSIFPKGGAMPLVSNLNWAAGGTEPNAVTVKVGTGGNERVFNPSGNVDVIFDINGYYG